MNINLTLFGQAITFAIFVWFTMRFVWPPLTAAMQERQQKIADGLQAAEQGSTYKNDTIHDRFAGERIVEMPGPTGEENLLSHIPVGSVLFVFMRCLVWVDRHQAGVAARQCQT